MWPAGLCSAMRFGCLWSADWHLSIAIQLPWSVRGGWLQSFGIDLNRLMVCGQSAGATLAAGLALLVRDHGRPKICAQLHVTQVAIKTRPPFCLRMMCPLLSKYVGEADIILIGNVRVGDSI
jgi:hypothetical protein